MLDQDKREEVQVEQNNEYQVTPLASFPMSNHDDLVKQEDKIVKDLIAAPTKEELQTQFDLFNMNQSKKNALRLIKLTNLMDAVEDQVIQRLTTRPDLVSNRELIDAMTVVSAQIEKTQKMNTEILNTEQTAIKITNTKNEVNINVGGELNRDEKERVLDAVQLLLKQVKGNSSIPLTPEEENNVIEANTIENSENDKNNEEEIVYTNDTILNTEE